MRFLLAAALALCACKRSHPPSDCSAGMADFQTWAKSMATTAPVACYWLPARIVERVALDDADIQLMGHLDPVERAPIVSVTRDEVLLDGQTEWEAPQPFEKLTRTLGADLDQLRKNYLMIHPRERFNGTFDLEIDGDAPWELVVNVLRVASRVGYPHLKFGFARDLDISEPPPSDDRKIEFYVSLALNERGALNRSVLVRKVFGDCAPARELIYSLAKVSDDNRRVPILFEDVPRAVESCGCSVDLAAAKRVLWVLHPRFGCAALSVTLDGKAPRFEAPAEITWSEAYRRVIKAVRSDAQARLNPVEIRK
jgi:hypothetical protein